MKWYDDEIFIKGEPDSHNRNDLNYFSSPSFRLALISSFSKGKVHETVDAFEDLFELFKPIIKRDAQQFHITEVAGKGARRRKSIKDSDWRPFEQLCTVIPEDDANWIGFDFKSNKSPYNKSNDIGPTKFYFKVMRTRKLDINIPVSDFENGSLDITRLKQCLLNIPSYSGLAGFGMCFTADISFVPTTFPYALIPVAKKYPCLDLCQNDERQWWPEYDSDLQKHWLAGINWLTLVCEPYLSALGGVKKITQGLDSAITWEANDDAVIFQLGERPITGQKGVDDDLLPLYLELGERLKPIGDGCPSLKCTHSVFGVADSVYGEEELRLNTMWARRFYDREWFKEFHK